MTGKSPFPEARRVSLCYSQLIREFRNFQESVLVFNLVVALATATAFAYHVSSGSSGALVSEIFPITISYNGSFRRKAFTVPLKLDMLASIFAKGGFSKLFF